MRESADLRRGIHRSLGPPDAVEALVSEDAGREPGIRTVPPELSGVDFHRIRIVRGSALILLVTLLAIGLTGLLGVRDATVSAHGEGYELRVEYPWGTRSGLDADWRLRLRHRGGFGRPVTIAYTGEYLDLLQVEDTFPAPIAELSAPPYRYFTFAPPVGDTLVVTFQAQTRPTVENSGPHHADVLVIVDGRRVVRTSYRTWLVP